MFRMRFSRWWCDNAECDIVKIYVLGVSLWGDLSTLYCGVSGGIGEILVLDESIDLFPLYTSRFISIGTVVEWGFCILVLSERFLLLILHFWELLMRTVMWDRNEGKGLKLPKRRKGCVILNLDSFKSPRIQLPLLQNSEKRKLSNLMKFDLV